MSRARGVRLLLLQRLSFRAWGVGAEGVEQAIKNCQWKANSQKCLREATVSVDPFANRSIGEGQAPPSIANSGSADTGISTRAGSSGVRRT